MSSDFEPWPDMPSNRKMPSLNDMFAQRLAQKTGQSQASTTATPDGFDPCDLMVKRKKAALSGENNYGEEPKPPEVQQFPEEDVRALEDYCRRMGIIGFSTKQNPRLALMKLKQQVGDMSDTPLEKRIIPGYEQVGIKAYHESRPNFPYQTITQKKVLLNG